MHLNGHMNQNGFDLKLTYTFPNPKNLKKIVFFCFFESCSFSWLSGCREFPHTHTHNRCIWQFFFFNSLYTLVRIYFIVLLAFTIIIPHVICVLFPSSVVSVPFARVRKNETFCILWVRDWKRIAVFANRSFWLFSNSLSLSATLPKKQNEEVVAINDEKQRHSVQNRDNSTE